MNPNTIGASMNKELAKQKIMEIKNKSKSHFNKVIQNDNELYQWILDNSKFLDGKNYSLSTRIYVALNEIKSFDDKRMRCKQCGKIYEKNVDDMFLGYVRLCSIKCGTNASQEKREQTMISKYGSKDFLSSKSGKEMKENWCKEHGVINAYQLESVKEKAAQSRKEHFGYEYTMQSPEKRALARKNYKEKTGYEHQSQNPEVMKKIKDTYFENKRLGKSKKDELFHLTVRKRRYNDLCLNKYVIPLFTFEEFISEKNQYNREFKWKCLECNTEFIGFINQNLKTREDRPARCPNCHPVNCGTSNSEKEIYEFITSIYQNQVIHNDRSVLNPKELDIYIPDKKLAIEYNGLFWHSDLHGTLNKTYHLNKLKECEKQGIHLIHIFENEWVLKQEIVKSRLKNLLGIYDHKCYARECEIKEISSKESIVFQNENHIQGSVKSSINVGLFYHDELISLMTFSKPRFSKKYEWELVRFCNKLGWHIPGSASKLLTYFEKTYHPKSILSYADRRWTMNNYHTIYDKLGFKLTNISKPNYWYFANNSLQLESRIKYQKHKLKNLLKKFDSSKTEIENMHDNDYGRIFDCGNLVYEKYLV